jgi:hypothetical protein
VTPSLPAVFGVSWQYSLLLFYIYILWYANVMGLGAMGHTPTGPLDPAGSAAATGCFRAADLAKLAAGAHVP